MMGVREIGRCLEQWRMEVKDLRRRMILAPTPRERERWYAMLLLAQGWTAVALERDPHTIGPLRQAQEDVGLLEGRACSPDIRADRRFPPALDEAQQEELKAAVQEPPGAPGIDLANWSLWQAQEEGSASVCRGLVRHWVEPKQLSELAAPAGVCLQADQEASAQG